MTNQCVILVGGFGTRLGALTRETPKPLLPVGGRPFLSYLLLEAARFGFTNVVLLAGYLGGQVVAGFSGAQTLAERSVDVRVVVESEPAGTGGALVYLRDLAEPNFLLMNGDSWFDIDLRAFAHAAEQDDALVTMALRQIDDAARYGLVELEGRRVKRFLPRGGRAGLINAGVYFVRRNLLEEIAETPCSLEQDIFPRLIAQDQLAGVAKNGFFIDIGIPDDYAEADRRLADQRRRSAVIFDVDDPAFDPQAFKITVKRVNAEGYAFAVTNSAERCDATLAEIGAHIDEWVLGDAVLDLLNRWPTDRQRRFWIGDTPPDGLGVSVASWRGDALESIGRPRR